MASRRRQAVTAVTHHSSDHVRRPLSETLDLAETADFTFQQGNQVTRSCLLIPRCLFLGRNIVAGDIDIRQFYSVLRGRTAVSLEGSCAVLNSFSLQTTWVTIHLSRHRATQTLLELWVPKVWLHLGLVTIAPFVTGEGHDS